MSGKTILGIVLIVLGALAIAYQGFTYTTQKKEVDIGPIEVTRKSIMKSTFLRFLEPLRLLEESRFWI